MPNKHLATNDPLQAKLEPLRAIPSMISDLQRIALYGIGRNHTGQGSVVEVGSWLGSSCAHVGLGLADAGSRASVTCFDRFCPDRAEVEKAAALGVALHEGQDTSQLFAQHVLPIYPHVTARRTEVTKLRWDGGPIEIYIDDASKHPTVFRHTLSQIGPALIPGVSVVALLDFWYFLRLPAGSRARRTMEYQLLAMDRLAKHFSLLRDHHHGDSGAFFRYEAPIDFNRLHWLLPPSPSLGYFRPLRKLRQSVERIFSRAA